MFIYENQYFIGHNIILINSTLNFLSTALGRNLGNTTALDGISGNFTFSDILVISTVFADKSFYLLLREML